LNADVGSTSFFFQKHYETYSVPVKRRLVEFRVTPDAVLAPGTPILATHFVPGQFVDVAGTT
jgi:large subunit ribosomal protein L3